MTKNIFKKIIFLITVILLLAVIAFTIFMVSSGYSFNDLSIMLSREKIKDIGIYKTINISDRNVSVCYTDEFIYSVSSNKVLIYDLNGELMNEFINDFSNPVIASNDEYVVVYDNEQTVYEVYTEGNRINTVNEDHVLAISVNETSGISLIKASSDGYLGEVITYQLGSQSVASVKYADLYPVSSAYLNDSDSYVVAKIDSLDINNTYIDVFNLYKEEAISGMKIEGSYLMVKPGSSNHFVVVSDHGYQIYDIACEQSALFECDMIQCENNGQSLYMAYRLNGKNYIQVFNSDLTEYNNKTTDYSINGVTSYADLFATYDNQTITIYDNDLKTVETLTMFSMIEKVLLLDNDSIAVIGNDDIVLYKYQ